MTLPSVHRMTARLCRGFVLAFHDIAADAMERFVDALWPIRPVPLPELVARGQAGRSTAGLCAITVDDGVGQTVESLAGICLRRAWPVTFYLPTGNVDTGEGLAHEWWRRIFPYLAGRCFHLPLGAMDFSRHDVAWELSRVMERLWHDAPLAAYRPLTMQLAEAVSRQAGVPMDCLRPLPPVSWERVAELSRSDLIRFESHGVSHTAMSALPEPELAAEMRRSRERISEHTGRPCRHLAYPFGSLRSIGALAPIVARRYYDSAATMNLGHVDAADPWLLPRIPLYQENSLAAARLKVLWKCSRWSRGRAGTGTPAAPMADRRQEPTAISSR